MAREVGVIINAQSGTEDMGSKVATLRDAFLKNEINPEFYLVNSATPVSMAVQKAIAQGHRIIAAAGGDGTQNAVATELLNTDVSANLALGIIPYGTFNHFAQDLNIPLGLEEAVNVIAHGVEHMIDVATVNDTPFVNNSSIGIYSKLVGYREEQQQSGWSKRIAAVQAVISVMWNYSFMNVEVLIDGKQMLRKTPLIFVGNNEYEIGGFNLVKRQRMDSGNLCVYIVKHSSRLGLFMLGIHALKGTLSGHEQLDEYVTKELTLTTRKNFLRVAIDGEIISLQSPLRYTIKPQALRVIIPA